MKKGSLFYSLWFIVVLVSLLVGSCSSEQNLNTNWHMYQNREAVVGYPSAALFADDIPNPSVKVLSDGWKLITKRNNLVDWGWKIEVSLNKVPIEKIPMKYRQEKKINDRWSIEPLENPPFNAKITYKLEDKDGFVVAEDILSVTLIAGKSETFQKESTLPLDKALRAATSKIEITFEKTER